MIKLIDANEEYLDEYKEAYFMSIEKINEGLIKKHDLMFYNPNEEDVVKKFMDSRDKSKLPEGWVPSYDYFIVDDDKFIGRISIRVELTPSLLNFGGHIGYGIHPKYWKMGYGTEALKLGLEVAKKLGIDKVLLTCDDDNIGSYKIIEKNGGMLENKVMNESCGEIFLTRRYWIDIK